MRVKITNQEAVIDNFSWEHGYKTIICIGTSAICFELLNQML